MTASSLLPGTTHVFLDYETFPDRDEQIVGWLQSQDGSRVDVLAYQDDDLLYHSHYFTVEKRWIHCARFGPTISDLESWNESLQQIGDRLKLLFAFSNNDTALLFKLTFGGA